MSAAGTLAVVDAWLEEFLLDLDAAEETADEVRDMRELIAPHLEGGSLEDLLRAATSHDIVELVYHRDADPGDGSGWALVLGDRTEVVGSLERVTETLRAKSAGGQP